MNQLIEETYRRQAGSLTRFLTRFLDSAVDIEDVMQDAFLKVFEAERNVRIKSPDSYLYKTAQNLALNTIAKRQRRRTDLVEEFDGLAVDCALDAISHVDAESESLREEELSLAAEAIDQLTPRVRQVFVLRKVYGFSHKEISHDLGIAVSTVQKHIASGVLNMKRCNIWH